MKFFKLTTLVLAAFLAASCGSDDDGGGSTTPTGVLTGSITTNTTYDANGSYTLQGALIVEPNVTVTFEQGSVITANKTDGVDYVLVKNGGKLIINGTADAPVVFTEASKVPGSWGGIIMYGDAPITASGGAVSATSEDGNDLAYGGTNATHNGGSLNYVRVEYAGKKITDGTSEMNGFSFYSVGSGTTLNHLVSYMGADDGFEFYGGTVSAQNLISYGNFDDSFDWQDGWHGNNNSNWMAIQTGTGNYGMEIEASNNNNDVFPIIGNLTLIRKPGTQTESNDAQYDAIQFKKQGNGKFNNVLITGYGSEPMATACRIQDMGTYTNQVGSGKIELLTIHITDGVMMYDAGYDDSAAPIAFDPTHYTTDNTATGASFAASAWTTVDGVSLLD